MSRCSNVADSTYESIDHVVKNYHIAHNQMDGLLLLSPSTLSFMTATESNEMHYHVHLTVPYPDILHVVRETPHCFVIRDVAGRTYRFTASNTVTMSQIEAELQRSIGM